MSEETIGRLEGTRDILGGGYASSRAICDTLQALLGRHGYESIDTPILERTELFLRKSGGEQASKLYTFIDQGGRRLTLRPEFTASVIRAFVEWGGENLLPRRFQYVGPVFRYEPTRGGKYHQFTQLGAELIGAGSPQGDIEAIFLACRGLEQIGLADFRLVIGHVGVIWSLLTNLELSERTKKFLLESIGALQKGDEGLEQIRKRASEVGLIRNEAAKSHLGGLLEGMDEEEARAVVQGLLQDAGGESTGVRHPDEITMRLLQKLKGADDPNKMERGMRLVSQLCQVKGKPSSALRKAERIIRDNGLNAASLNILVSIFDVLKESQFVGEEVNVDFGLERGVAYYTGTVFEIYHPAIADGLPLCGGGRYDGLVRALGGKGDVPAIGFAYNVELLAEALEGEGKGSGKGESLLTEVLVVPSGSESYGKALQVAEKMCRGGSRVEMEVCGRTLEESIEYARKRGILTVITVDRDGKSTKYEIGRK